MACCCWEVSLLVLPLEPEVLGLAVLGAAAAAAAAGGVCGPSVAADARRAARLAREPSRDLQNSVQAEGT
jgi:hypothetical protein